jgi:hypothetical protein
MGWQQTINTAVKTWAQRAKPEDARYSTEAGPPVELLVDLANELGAHPWFCIPHLADDDYVRRFARLVRERLKPGLKAYVEYSNEVWNWLYPATHYAKEMGQKLGLGDPPQQRFYAQRSVEVFKIWEEELGGRERLVRVLGSQLVNPWLSEQILTWRDAYKHADALAVAPYFGFDITTEEAARAYAGLTIDQLGDRLQVLIDGEHRNHIREQVKVARRYGLELIAYEGGQHLAGVLEATNNKAMVALFSAANRSPRMYALTTRHLEHWFAEGGGLYVAFNYVYAPTKYGSWGLLEYQDQPLRDAPKYRAILDTLGDASKKRPGGD